MKMTITEQSTANVADMERHLPEQAADLCGFPPTCSGMFDRGCGKATTDRGYCDKCGAEWDRIVQAFGDPLKARRSFEDRTAQILSRFSIFDLREMSVEDLERGEEMLMHGGPLKVIASGTENLIDWWKVESGGNVYEVRRFLTFFYCSCKDFHFGKSACKHLAVTIPPACKCGRAVEERGQECAKCEQHHALYLKPTSFRKVMKIGGVRV